MAEYRTGFTGTQRGMTRAQATVVGRHLWDKQSELHHGDCVGSDAQAHRIARALRLDVVLHPPINPAKRAWCDANHILPERDYLDRNHDIVDATDEMIATPGEFSEQLRSGTWATIRYARRRGKPVTVIYPNGATSG